VAFGKRDVIGSNAGASGMQVQNSENFATRKACSHPSMFCALDARQRVYAESCACCDPVALVSSVAYDIGGYNEKCLLSALKHRRVEDTQRHVAVEEREMDSL
jgi:hypothetical protein